MNPYWFFQIYILGIFLGFLAWKTNSIIAPLILHGLNNFIALLLSFQNHRIIVFIYGKDMFHLGSLSLLV